jgi:cytidylate kinase
MITLRIEHKIANYDGWKKAFDSDPINRKQSGVKRYRVYHPIDDTNFIIIDLEFDNLEKAQAAQVALMNKIFPDKTNFSTCKFN